MKTGQTFEGSELSPFLGKGITIEYLQISANLPSLKDLLKLLRGTATSFATALSILLVIPLDPVALFGFKSSMKDATSCAVHVVLDNLF